MGTQNVASEMELLLSWPVWPLQPVIPFPVRHPSSPPGRESEGERERERERDERIDNVIWFCVTSWKEGGRGKRTKEDLKS